jgi:hypothetical protein
MYKITLKRGTWENPPTQNPLDDGTRSIAFWHNALNYVSIIGSFPLHCILLEGIHKLLCILRFSMHINVVCLKTLLPPQLILSKAIGP